MSSQNENYNKRNRNVPHLYYSEMEAQTHFYEVPSGSWEGLGLLFALTYCRTIKGKLILIITAIIYKALKLDIFLQI